MPSASSPKYKVSATSQRPGGGVMRGAHFPGIACHEVFFKSYSPLGTGVNRRLFIGCLGFMTVNTIKKHLSGTHSVVYSPEPKG